MTNINHLEGFFDGEIFYKGPLSIRIENEIICEISNTPFPKTSINAKGCILSPSFNDGHTHLLFSGDRFSELSKKLKGVSYTDILKGGGGITKTVESTKLSSNRELTNHLINRLNTMLSHGTTFVEIKTGYGLSVDEELRHLRLLNSISHEVDISITFGGAHIPPIGYPREKYIADIIDVMLPIISQEKLAFSTDVFCDKGAFTIGETEQILRASKKFNIPIRVHAEELIYTGVGMLAAEKFNALSVDHLLYATQSDFEIYEKHNTSANFMPLAPLGLFTNQIPNGWENTNVNIGLGSDFNPNNWIISMQTAIRMAVYRYRMTPLHAFKAATLGSYQSITGNKATRLGVGSKANFIILKAKSLEEVCSKIGQNLVTHVFKNGKQIITNYHKTT